MSRKTSPRKSVPPVPGSDQPYNLPNDAKWGGFINIRLDEEQKNSFLEWFADGSPHVEQSVDDMLAMGLKFSLSFDGTNQCVVCSVTGSLVGSDPEGRYTSTSRASSRNEALGLTVWKHYALCAGDYGNYSPKSSTFMSWG